MWVESGGPKCCITFASFECTAQRESFPRPNSHRMCGPILHICSDLKLGVWGWEWETARTLPTSHTIFSEIAFHLPHQFWPQNYHQNWKNISYPLVCSGQETVRWKQSYAFRGLFGHVCAWKKGVTQWWGRPGSVTGRTPFLTLAVWDHINFLESTCNEFMSILNQMNDYVYVDLFDMHLQ